MIFVLVMLLNIVFDFAGNPIVLGNINIIGTVIYALFTVMLMNALAKKPE